MSKALNDEEFWTFTATVRDDPGEPVKVGGDEGQAVVLGSARQISPLGSALTGKTEEEKKTDEARRAQTRKIC